MTFGRNTGLKVWSAAKALLENDIPAFNSSRGPSLTYPITMSTE